jgi:hypothetical protein
MSRPTRRAASKKIDYSTFDADIDLDSDFKDLPASKREQDCDKNSTPDQNESKQVYNISIIGFNFTLSRFSINN